MITVIAACATLTAYKLRTAVRADAWFSETHRDITKKALALLEKEGKAKEYAFFKKYEKELIEGCTEPDDEGDVDRGPGMHYYSVCDPKGKELPEKAGYYRNRLKAFSKSARTSLEENYTSALSLFYSGRLPEAFRVFARAAHFIEDMSCTVHVTNSEYQDKPTNLHNAFEKNINTICGQFTADRFDKRIARNYEGVSFENAANKLIRASAKFIKNISTLDPLSFRNDAETMLPLAQQNVMALMLKFYADCKSTNTGIITDGKTVTFKNSLSGLVLVCDSKGLRLDRPDQKKAQRFTAVISGRGSFGFAAEDGQYINDRFSALEKVKDSSEPSQFRLAALGNKCFRITTGATGFERVLGSTPSGGLVIDKFDPENRFQVWVIG